jgi:hypothetical protein
MQLAENRGDMGSSRTLGREIQDSSLVTLGISSHSSNRRTIWQLFLGFFLYFY